MASPQDIRFNVTANNQASEVIKQLTGQFGEMKGQVGQVTGAISGLAPAIASVTALLAGGKIFSDSIQAFKDQAAETRKLINVFGLSTDAASQMRVQLALVGIATDDFTAMAFKLDKQLKSNEAGLNAIGVVTRSASGAFLDQKTIMENAVQTMMSYKAGTDRNEAAMLMFGRSAAEAFQLLKLNEATMQRAAELTSAFALTLDKVALKSASEYKESMNEVKIASEGLASHVGQELMPGLTSLAHTFVDIAKSAMPAVTSGADGIGDAVSRMASTISNNKTGIISAFQEIAKAISWTIDRFATFGNAAALYGMYKSGEISFTQYALSGPEEAKKLVEEKAAKNKANSANDGGGADNAYAMSSWQKSQLNHAVDQSTGTQSGDRNYVAPEKASSAAKAAAAEEEKLANARIAAAAAVERVIDRENFATKAIGEYQNGINAVDNALTIHAINSAKAGEALDSLNTKLATTFAKPFDDVITEMGKVADPLEKFTSAYTKVSTSYTEEITALDKVLGDSKTSVSDYADASTLKMQTEIKAQKATDAVTAALGRELKAKDLNVSVTNENAKAVTSAYTAYEESRKSITSNMGRIGEASGLNTSAVSALTAAMIEMSKGVDLNKNSVLAYASVLQAIGYQIGGTTGAGVTNIGKGITALSTGVNTDGMTSDQAATATSLNTVGGVTAITNGIGSVIGGKVGAAVSSASSSALTGAVIGSIVPGIGTVAGAIIGGASSLISSIFGGGASAQDVATAQSNASSGASSISAAASSGNSVAQEIMRRAGYSTTTLSVSAKMSDLSGMGLDQYMGTGVKDYGLFYTKENNYNATLTEAVTNIGKIEASINKFSNATVVQTLSDIQYKWDAIEATVGVSADSAKARLSDIFTSVLSLSADNVGTAIASAFSSYSGYSSAGEKAATTIADSLITSIQDVGLTSTISDIIMPLYESALTPYLTKITSGLKLTADDYSEISSVMSTLKASTTETVNSIYDLYTASGLLTSAQKSAADSTNNLVTTYTNLTDSSSSLISQLQGIVYTQDQQRSITLSTLNDASKALQSEVWSVQDAATNLITAKTAVTDSLSALKSTVDAQKSDLTAIYNAQKSALDTQITAQNAVISNIRTVSDQLHSSISSFTTSITSAENRKSAQGTLSEMLLSAQNGVLPDTSQLSTVLSVLSQSSSSQFGNSLDYQKDYYKTVQQVTALSALTDNKLTDAQQQLSIAQQQLTVLQNSYNVQSSSLDATYNVAVQQVNALYGINSSVLTVAQAVANLGTSMASYTTTQTAVTKTQTDASAALTTKQNVSNYETAKAAQLNAIDYQQKSNWTVADVAESFAQNNLTAQQHSNLYAAIEGLPTYGTAGSYSQDLAQKMYTVFLGRSANTTEDTYWTNRISQIGINQVTKDITSSPEYLSKNSTIASLYSNILMRSASGAEISAWNSTGRTISQIKDDILGSPEYMGIKNVRGFATGGYATGGTDSGWIMAGEGSGTELINLGTSDARIYTNKQSQSLMDLSPLIQSNNDLKDEVIALQRIVLQGNLKIGNNTRQTRIGIDLQNVKAGISG